MSQKSGSVLKALAGVAVLAGFCYVVARRNSTRPPQKVAPSPPALEGSEPAIAAAWEDDAASVSAPSDALDIALGLEGVEEDEGENGVELTARVNDHLPLPRAGDDEDAPAPDELASAWLTHATESERSLTGDDLVPDVESLELTTELSESYSDEGDDETTREYVRRHRISSRG
jgi:hypothetical protein